MEDQESFKDSQMSKDGLKITNKTFSPSATFSLKDKEEKKQFKPLSTVSTAYNYANIYNSTVPTDTKALTEIKPKTEYSILNYL